MKRVIVYVKTHKLTVFLSLVVLYFILRDSVNLPSNVSILVPSRQRASSSDKISMPLGNGLPSLGFSDANYELIPNTKTTERKVVTNSNFSLLVKNVTETIDQIRTKATAVSGYIIDVNIYRGASSESANLTLRVPNNRVSEVSKFLRSISVKVVSEDIVGSDITDQYEDVEARLAELQKVKSKLEAIMDSANTSDEMLRIFKQINDVNSQIDSYKGRLKYMEDASSTSKLTIALSTDELSLPYTPDQPWRPEVVLKSAIRSLLTTLQSIGTFIIWLAVYIPVIALTFIVYKVVKLALKRKNLF